MWRRCWSRTSAKSTHDGCTRARHSIDVRVLHRRTPPVGATRRTSASPSLGPRVSIPSLLDDAGRGPRPPELASRSSLPHLTADNAVTLAGARIRTLQAADRGAASRPSRRSRMAPRAFGACLSGPLLPSSSRHDPSGRHLCSVRARSLRSSPAVSPPQPLAPDRYRIQFTADASFCSKLDRLEGSPASVGTRTATSPAIIDRAVTELVGRLEARRFGLTPKPRASGARTCARSVALHSRWTSAGRSSRATRGGAASSGPNGQRCPARRQLEFHHVEPYARGGSALDREHPAHVPHPQRAPGGA